MRADWLVATLAAAVAVVWPTCVIPARAQADAGMAVDVVRSGPWQATAGEASERATAQAWTLEAKLDPARGVLSGEVVIDGSPLVRVGTVEARVDGARVIGIVRDDEGAHVANLTGRLDAHGASGRFADRTGGVGSWSFRGALQLPAAPAEAER